MKDFNNVLEDNEYIFAQMFLRIFILNKYFCIKATINLIKFDL